jgi:hypothetical protein
LASWNALADRMLLIEYLPQAPVTTLNPMMSTVSLVNRDRMSVPFRA